MKIETGEIPSVTAAAFAQRSGVFGGLVVGRKEHRTRGVVHHASSKAWEPWRKLDCVPLGPQQNGCRSIRKNIGDAEQHTVFKGKLHNNEDHGAILAVQTQRQKLE